MSVAFMTEEGTKKANQAIKDGGKYMYVNYGAVLDLCESHIIDTIQHIRDHGDYRFEVKYLAKNAKREIDKLIGQVRLDTSKSSELYYDIIDELNETIKSVEQSLYWSVVQVLDRMKVKDSKYKAHIEVTSLLLEYANTMFNEVCNIISEMAGTTRAGRQYAYLCPRVVTDWWDKLAVKLDNLPIEVMQALNKDENIANALEILSIKLTCRSETNKVYKKIAEMHPEVVCTLKK